VWAIYQNAVHRDQSRPLQKGQVKHPGRRLCVSRPLNRLRSKNTGGTPRRRLPSLKTVPEHQPTSAEGLGTVTARNAGSDNRIAGEKAHDHSKAGDQNGQKGTFTRMTGDGPPERSTRSNCLPARTVVLFSVPGRLYPDLRRQALTGLCLKLADQIKAKGRGYHRVPPR